jgi:uncharacterized protein YneF (UPF0154 family)
MSYFLIPLFIIAGLLVFFLVLVFLARFRNGRYLKPVIETLSKVPWLRRQFQKASQAAIEKHNPDLANAIRKIQRVGPNPDEKRLQQAYHSLSPAERRAYQEMADQQGVGGVPEGANREQRRRAQRLQQTNRARPAPAKSTTDEKSGSKDAAKRGKRR